MNQRPLLMSKGTLIGATERAKQRVQDWIDLANAATNDTRHAQRIASHECKACFYSSRMGGAAITTRNCMCCSQPQTYGSTNTDVLCLPCAKEGSLCKHCGADLELRTRRRNWPSAYSDTPPAN